MLEDEAGQTSSLWVHGHTVLIHVYVVIYSSYYCEDCAFAKLLPVVLPLSVSEGDKAMSGSLHFDNPPPYDKTLGGGRRYDDADVNRFSPCSEETPMILK